VTVGAEPIADVCLICEGTYLALLGGEVALVSAAHLAGLPPTAGYALACALAAAVGFGYVRVRLASLLDDTFQSQPFGDAL